MISIILPTFNEALNIPVIIPKIAAVLQSLQTPWEIIVVDDNSPDGTADSAEKLQAELPVRVIRRTTEKGLASAVIAGFAAAKGSICIVMDADMSHPVEKLPEMIRPIQQDKCDITVGSRYVDGGESANWPIIRQFISRASGLLAMGLTRLSDPTSGFMAVKKSTLEGLELNPIGWKIVLEVVARSGARVIEVPITFTDRIYGESKLDSRAKFEYLLHLWRLYNYCLPNFLQFVKFCLVGASGLVVDTTTLIIAVEQLGADPRVGAIFAFFIAVTWNYILDKRWTFGDQSQTAHFGGYFGFVSVCLIGLVVRIAIMHLLLVTLGIAGRWYIVANFVGVIVATVLNFAGSKYFVFRQNRGIEAPL